MTRPRTTSASTSRPQSCCKRLCRRHLPDGRDRPTTRALFWVEPEARGIIPLDGFHVPQRLARTVRARRLRDPHRHDFDAVIAGCAGSGAGPRRDLDQRPHPRALRRALRAGPLPHASRPGRTASWSAASTASRSARAFFGESMFSRERDASKVALVHLVARLQARRLPPARHPVHHRAPEAVRRRRRRPRGNISTLLEKAIESRRRLLLLGRAAPTGEEVLQSVSQTS